MERKTLCIIFCTLLIIPLLPTAQPTHITPLPPTTDPHITLFTGWTQQQKLLTSDGTFGDCFGFTIALDGDTALIGAFGDSTQGDIGSAYIFTRTGTTWTQQAKLFPTSGGYYDFFGYAVALDDDTALIGAPGSQFNPPYPGAAYIFTRTGTTWTQQAKLIPDDGNDGDYFGNSVALDGDTALIGSEYWSGTGSTYVFTRTGTSWTQRTKITPYDGINGEMFGYSLSLEGTTCLIGAPMDDDNGGASGSVYVYTGSGGTWTPQTKLLATDGAQLDSFGISVSLHTDTALIGADWDSDNGEKSGSAYIFTRTGTSWTQQAKLLPTDGTPEACFGHSVSLYGDTALIGADEDDDPVYNAGSAYLFTRTDTTWTQQNKLLPTDEPEGRLFGEAVSIDADTALIGAYGDSDNGPGAGATYVFIKQNTPPTPPEITGPAEGKPKTPYTYNLQSTDPDNQQLSYYIDWGDGTNSGWIGPYASEESITATHTWSKKGSYTIQAKAKDIQDLESDWGTFEIAMPYSLDLPSSPFWQRLLEWFPHAFTFLYHLIGL